MWYAILDVDRDLYRKLVASRGDKSNTSGTQLLQAKGATYCLSVHAFSNLRMNCAVSQTGFVPGSTLSLRAVLNEYNLPLQGRAAVRAELEYPDHTGSTLALGRTAQGVFETSIVASQAGIYRFRVLAEGGTYRGVPFSREQLLTAAVFHDIPVPPSGGDRDAWCRLLACLLNEHNLSKDLEEQLKRQGVNLEGIRRCIEMFCKSS
jgi:hypothetical protein